MRAADFLILYQSDSLVQSLAEGIRTSASRPLRIKGLSGSQDAVFIAALHRTLRTPHLVVLDDKEEAAAFFSDVQNLLGEKEVFFFPMSYKRAYEYDETENANVLMRAETLNSLSTLTGAQLIITYPEALSEKVITKSSLNKNTFTVELKSKLNLEFLEEFLFSYDFEKTDFVYEAGQFAIRGGIIDVFSFAHELPYRIELFGDEVDSIRSFDPGSQLSVTEVTRVNLMPNVQTRLVKEDRQSLMEFLPGNARIWIKDVQRTSDILATCFEKASNSFDRILRESGGTKLALEPFHLFVTSDAFFGQLAHRSIIEFGSRSYFQASPLFEFKSSPQPSFNKNFELLAKNLIDHQVQGYSNFIAAEQGRQLDRLHGIFEEIQPALKFQSLDIPLCRGFVDHSLKLVCYTDHQIFDRFHRFRTKEKLTKSKALTFRELQSLQPGDFVTHIDYGIGKFAGLEKKEVNGRDQEAVRLVFRDNDLLYVSIHSLHKISRYSGREGAAPIISKLGSDEWENKKARVRKQVKDIARDLIELYAKRKRSPGFAFSPDSFLQAELESSFIYEDTPDQAKATDDVKKDMESPHPMDRLVCGDVGFGKTEVAVRAAFKATTDGKQVAVLVPTTILAMQHFRTFSERLANFPLRIEYVSRFKSDRDIKKILQETKEGSVNILIGTHRVISKDVEFKNLGLLVIDEEQKFGVKAKDRLKELRVSVDVLTLTATPIPRTLHFSLMGARDLSIIATPPPNRQPVTTELHTYNEEIIRDAVSHEIRRGGQVFFVHNRISDIESIANTIYKLVPDARIGIAHGQMDGDKLEKIMVRFIEGEYDVLVSTNIIESGLDIPNANTIIINQAHMFGLSDLHQMRGRVGRSNKKAFCYLLTPPTAVLSSDSRKRLAAVEEFSELGDGFKVAMRDLDIRGAGNLLGAEQSGFINDLGFDTYHKILDDAIQELKESEFKDLFAEELSEKAKQIVPDCVIETDLEILIPETYVSSTRERLQLYSTLDDIADEPTLQQFINGLKDRFGECPPSVMQLVNTVRLRWICERLGFEKVVLKNGRMRATFVGRDEYFKSETFGRVLAFIQRHPKQCRLKDHVGQPMITVEDISSVDSALQLLSPLDVAPG
ncbi:MAG: transcription-repair coupling factor [Cyclobacteriaceae bacterium]|nr:transcription-repair coupling factor [Cyclobacteriaceae bacterium]